MNPQSSSSPADAPQKRKRGRPRKEESPVQAEAVPPTPKSDSSKKNKQSAEPETTTAVVRNDMLGQSVSGVIEGSFDAGYLLKVKIGNDDTPLRGVVFLPGKYTPLTASNDVAPQVKMYSRTEMPMPVQSPPVPGQCEKQAIEAQNIGPTVEVQVEGLTSEPQSSTPIAPESQLGSSSVVPLASSARSSFEIHDSGLGSSASDKVGEQSDLLKEFEASLAKAPNSEQSKPMPPPSAPTVDTSPETQIEHQATGSDIMPSQPGVENQQVEHCKSPTATTPEVMSPDPIAVGTSTTSPVKPAPASSKLNGKPESETGDNAVAESSSSLPVMPSPPKPATEGSDLEMMNQPGTEEMKVDSPPVTSLPFEGPDLPASESNPVSEKHDPQPRLEPESSVME